MKKPIFKICLMTLLIAAGLSQLSAVKAAPGKLVDQPLFVSSNVVPNVFFELDDSGSMDWETLVKGYWEACAYDRDSPGSIVDDSDCGTFVSGDGLFRTYSGSQFRDYAYLFDNTDNLYDTGCDGQNFPKLESCSAAVKDYDWRVRSSDFNVLFYNPAVTYLPWQNGDGTRMPNASFSAARSNPQSGQPGYTVTKNLAGFVYHVWSDTHRFTGNRPQRGANINRTTGTNGLVDYWDQHTGYTVNATTIGSVDVSYAVSNAAQTKGKLTINNSNSATLSGASATNPWQRTILQEQQNIANWYQYYRKRSFVAKAAIAQVITKNPNFRYGLNVINTDSFFTEVPSGTSGFAAHNLTLISDLYSYPWNALGTPLRGGLERAGKYFANEDGRTNPITLECQQNFTALITDGYWNDPDNVSTAIGDSDGDGHNLTLADVADYYYKKDLSPLANNVTPSAFDKATYQHMVTYGVAFGLTGFLTDTDNDGWPGNSPGLAENGNWGDPFMSGPEKIDDLWHSAFNAKGSYVSATTPELLASALTKQITDITNRIGSSASVAFNTSSLSSDSTVYIALFNRKGDNWSGDLFAYPVDQATGSVSSTPKWQVAGNPSGAAGILDAMAAPATSRTILTYNGTAGVSFHWANLTTPQKDDLKTEPNATVATDVKGQARVAYLRGDRTNEQSKNGTYSFKDRASLLGDFVDSDPVYVGKPTSSWPNTAPFPTTTGKTYSDFAAAKASRPAMLYVGANDGMMHGFSTADGSEKLGYIPASLYASGVATTGLHYLTDVTYGHRFYVDLGSTVEDAYFSKDGVAPADWHTVLVGGLRGGGKGVFALDVTDPAAFSEANAANIALWEFDNTDDADMGYSFSKPIIGLMQNGRWAAVFGNGYNNNGDGKAKLFILYLDGGADGVWTPGTDYVEISTNAGSITSADCENVASDCNGLSTPQTADINSDYMIDRVYAGDLKGNMWVFDLSDSDASKWGVAFSGSPLFAGNQPITSKPSIMKHPTQATGASPNLMVYFGTGEYLVTNDLNSTATQGFYGVWDHGVASITTSTLVEQTFLSGTFTNIAGVDTSGLSVLTDNPVDYSGKNGWFIRLTKNTGERVVVDPDVFSNVLFFNTWIPNNTPCGTDGEGVLMSVRTDTGGRPMNAVFSLTGSKFASNKELVTMSGTNYTVSGQRFKGGGLPSSSSFLPDHQYTAGTNSGSKIDERTLLKNPVSSMKRISWQEIR